MTPNQYQTAAKRTLVTSTPRDTIVMCGLGIAGEAGEVCDIIKKFYFHRSKNPLDKIKTVDELSDVCWYVAILSDALDIDLAGLMPGYKPVESMDRLALKLAVRAGHVADKVFTFTTMQVQPGNVEYFRQYSNIDYDLQGVLTYVNAIASAIGTDLEAVFTHNIDKLTRRHAGVRFNPDYISDSTQKTA